MKPHALVAIGAFFAGVAALAQPAEAPVNARWQVVQTVPAHFPAKMLQAGVRTGEAHVRVSVLASGQLADALVIATTSRDFGEEALRVIRYWRFRPAYVDSVPVGVVGLIVFTFEKGGMAAVDLRAGDDLHLKTTPSEYRAFELGELDRVPATVHTIQPVYPKDWLERGVTGSATIEYYIDELGRARVPAIVSTTDSRLAGFAASAVTEWRYEPPLRRGVPVLVRVEQDFKFAPPPSAAKTP